MLKLNEKMIRKGRALGLPYQGSKKKISKKIVEIIKQNFGTDKPVYDIFGGGGAVAAECLINGIEVHYNDLDPPYENTTLKGYTVKEFNSQSFYDWAYEMSKKNIVLISSYEISDSRFKCVYEFTNARSTFSSGTYYGKQTEKLFMVK